MLCRCTGLHCFRCCKMVLQKKEIQSTTSRSITKTMTGQEKAGQKDELELSWTRLYILYGQVT